MKRYLVTVLATAIISVAGAVLGVDLNQTQVECVSETVADLAVGE